MTFAPTTHCVQGDIPDKGKPSLFGDYFSTLLKDHRLRKGISMPVIVHQTGRTVSGGPTPRCCPWLRVRGDTHLKMESAFRNVRDKFGSQISGR